MDAEEFYEEFKAALQFLNLPWADKHLATVWVEGTSFNIQYKHKRMSIELEKVSE